MNLGMILARFGYNLGIIIYVRLLITKVPGWAKIKGDESRIKTRIMTGILIIALVAVSAGVAAAQYGQGGGAGGARYVDANGDGVCDNFGTNGRDSDGDGIQNGKDGDYERSRDGSGRGNGGDGKGRDR
jgi:hypothetical protein